MPRIPLNTTSRFSVASVQRPGQGQLVVDPDEERRVFELVLHRQIQGWKAVPTICLATGVAFELRLFAAWPWVQRSSRHGGAVGAVLR